MNSIDSATHEQPSWQHLLVQHAAPTWVPNAVADAFVAAHGRKLGLPLTVSDLRIDTQQRRIELSAPKGRLTPPDDLAHCIGSLLRVAIDYPHVARHVFQQGALLWRAYREASLLEPNSEFEAQMVQETIHTLSADAFLPPDVALSVTTLHQLVDALHDAIRDMRAKN